MPVITFPDQRTESVDSDSTLYSVAESIAPGLAKRSVAAELDGQLVDLSYPLTCDTRLRFITLDDEEALEVLRHSSAHLLAQAVQRLFNDVQVTIGPVIDEGFYYDFVYERGFTPDDLEKIEAEMAKIVAEDLPVSREVVTRDEAVALFKSMGEDYKVKIIEDIPGDETLSLYRQGEFVDLCRGPHVPRTGLIKAFKLTKISGAYWRGDSNNAMLQRIYGTAWSTPKALKAYLRRIEEAKKRDHRVLAQKMDLFHIEDGMVYWHPNGWAIIMGMRTYLREVLSRSGYQEVNTPALANEELWQLSGHRAQFADNMFSLAKGADQVDLGLVVKPMNCPCHVQIYNQGLKSYRDLPLRLAEFGACTRNEPSGALNGLLRLRGFVQDDAHIFCQEEQIMSEVLAFIELLKRSYSVFGFTDIRYKLSTRPEKRLGADEIWDQAESALSEALNAAEVDWQVLPGEGAFYGPKIEFSLCDCLGRVWQCGTIQVDFSMPGRLGAQYVAEDGSKRVPVMLHRALFGSFERFLAILLEETAGWLPVWLAPVQVVVMSVTDKQHAYQEKVCNLLTDSGLRVHSDLRNEKIAYKIREHTIARIPYQLVVGDKEVADGTVTVREKNNKKQTVMPLSDFVAMISAAADINQLL